MKLHFNKNALKNKIQHYKMSALGFLERLQSRRNPKEVQNEKADEASRESFPASDPPAYFSQNAQEKRLH